ncbi:MAG: SCO family protein [Dehalococcoidia bacterium]
MTDLYRVRRWALPLLALLATALLLTYGCSEATEGDADPTATISSDFGGRVLEERMVKPSFTLTDTSGEPFELRGETKGYVTLLYFGYTFCPDICPSHMADVAAVMDRNPDMKDHTKVVFVTVDPERDTPERLRSWLDLFNEDFVGLTGTPEEIQEAVQATFKDQAFEIVKTPTKSGYTVNHAAYVIPYSHDNVARVVWPFGTTQDICENDMLKLHSEGEH